MSRINKNMNQSSQGLELSPAISSGLSRLKKASRLLRQIPSEQKNLCLHTLAKILLEKRPAILDANRRDLSALKEDTPVAFIDRLTLTDSRLALIATSLQEIAALADPVGEVTDEAVRADGLRLKRVRSPLGVIFMIFESRPNVALEAFALAFKSGNAIALRGGSESSATLNLIYTLIEEALNRTGLPSEVCFGIEDYDRNLVKLLLNRPDLIDVTVPRGGEKLIEFVTTHARMPIIKNDRGMCHIYVDAQADLEMATKIVINAKTQRPGVCNATETLLVHEAVAERFLPLLHHSASAGHSPSEQVSESESGQGSNAGSGSRSGRQRLHYRCDSKALAIMHGLGETTAAEERDWDTEHLDLVLNVRVVNSIEQAIEHIELHGSRHSEAIITRDLAAARLFQTEVDAAAVYWNASTRFTDGFELGLGGELGISTQKLHVRGPVGLRELTSRRWIIEGDGHIRR